MLFNKWREYKRNEITGFLCQSIQKEKKLSKDENTEDIILPTPSSPPPQKKNLKWFEVAKLWQY